MSRIKRFVSRLKAGLRHFQKGQCVAAFASGLRGLDQGGEWPVRGHSGSRFERTAELLTVDGLVEGSHVELNTGRTSHTGPRFVIGTRLPSRWNPGLNDDAMFPERVSSRTSLTACRNFPRFVVVNSLCSEFVLSPVAFPEPTDSKSSHLLQGIPWASRYLYTLYSCTLPPTCTHNPC